MSRYPRTQEAMIAACLLVLLSSGASAQQKQWDGFRGKRITQFDWNCALPSAYPRSKLDRLVRSASSRHYAGVADWGDRAFSFDLNGDGRPEYFVPLVCGATGNCTWAAFSLRRPRLLGIIDGQYFYVFAGANRWPKLITYSHLNSAEGMLTTYKFGKRRYAPLKGGYYTDVSERNWKAIPKFLKRARPACAQLGY